MTMNDVEKYIQVLVGVQDSINKVFESVIPVLETERDIENSLSIIVGMLDIGKQTIYIEILQDLIKKAREKHEREKR